MSPARMYSRARSTLDSNWARVDVGLQTLTPDPSPVKPGEGRVSFLPSPFMGEGYGGEGVFRALNNAVESVQACAASPNKQTVASRI